MSPVAIPGWSADGVLPPISATQPTSAERSPYAVSLTDCVLRFGDTPERRNILGGLLRYRAGLHAVGLVGGFQWLDGSFLEHVEMSEGRAPNDVDVVTFYRLPPGTSQGQLVSTAGTLLDHGTAKATYLVDAYLVHLGMDPERLARSCAYWYSVWSHRRNRLWKGFVQIDLAPTDDPTATSTLANLVAMGGRP